MLPSTRPATMSAFTRYPRCARGSSFRLLLCAELLHLVAIDDSTGAEGLAVELRHELLVLHLHVEHAVEGPAEDFVEVDRDVGAVAVVVLHLAEVLDEVLSGRALQTGGFQSADERIR